MPPEAVEDLDHKDIRFFEMNPATKGYRGKMVDAVLKDLPEEWNVVVVMDWSDGFWDKMKKKYHNLGYDLIDVMVFMLKFSF